MYFVRTIITPIPCLHQVDNLNEIKKIIYTYKINQYNVSGY